MVFKYLAIDKLSLFLKIIYKNGGPFKAFYKFWRFDTLKDGKLMGTDSFGNSYYESPYYMLGRSRWVEYSPSVRWNYDASQVTAEWFGWLHYKTDRVPSKDCAKYCLMSCPCVYNWMLPHEENFTGTERAYYPYSTIRARLQVWDGRSICSRVVKTEPETTPEAPDKPVKADKADKAGQKKQK